MTSVGKIKKAVFPVAGLGTRFLPATKANPKEMLPIVDKPLIQYAVEEAIASGITELIFVTNGTKRAIEDHFDCNHDLESILKTHGKIELLEIVHNILPKGVFCSYVRQPEMKGLGHAILCASHVVGNEPFAVLLADDLIDSEEPFLQQLIQVYNENQSSVIAVQEVSDNDIEKYGVVDPLYSTQEAVFQIKGLIEKPKKDQAPSHFGIIGRYILTPKIFEYLTVTKPGIGGEIHITDALSLLLESEPLYARKNNGIRYDCGDKLGYLEATIQYAKKHPEIGEAFQKFLAYSF
ncbi:MAG: UTP--glucose-1-phosphate uridylyltransferase GalU [Gammaproteobacteria bacterium]|nr:UTP--glucose-1-phosphate uridylyltransferase GalU [Gammaproteobacteria bacterium]